MIEEKKSDYRSDARLSPSLTPVVEVVGCKCYFFFFEREDGITEWSGEG